MLRCYIQSVCRTSSRSHISLVRSVCRTSAKSHAHSYSLVRSVFCTHAERLVLPTATCEVSILEVLDEGESHGVDERRDHAESEVDAMSEEQDDAHHEFVRYGEIRAHLHSQRVEHTSEHTTCQAEGEEADVGEEVTQKTS